MKSAYLAICYICNENCSFCPCSKREKSDKVITPIKELKDSIDEMVNNNITDITISGGEPTLHPDLLELVEYIQSKNINITILTNSERFSDDNFTSLFISKVDKSKMKIITTLHSDNSYEHEKANLTPGSFNRTVSGLIKLSTNGIRIIIKHCITKNNYKDLKEFYEYCDKTFYDEVDIQLCSIDYCGVPKSKLNQEMLSFIELKPYLERAFDAYLIRKSNGSNRNLYCINMPLCSCDVYYWNLMSLKRKMYNSYKDPHKEDIVEVYDNVGVCEEVCNGCKVMSICSGTYNTAFEAFGDKIINHYR